MMINSHFFWVDCIFMCILFTYRRQNVCFCICIFDYCDLYLSCTGLTIIRQKNQDLDAIILRFEMQLTPVNKAQSAPWAWALDRLLLKMTFRNHPQRVDPATKFLIIFYIFLVNGDVIQSSHTRATSGCYWAICVRWISCCFSKKKLGGNRYLVAYWLIDCLPIDELYRSISNTCN